MSEKAPIATARAVNAADIMSNAAAPAIALAFNLLRSSTVPINAANVAAIKTNPPNAESISATLAKVFNAPAVIRRASARRSRVVPILTRDFWSVLNVFESFNFMALISFITPTNSANITVIAPKDAANLFPSIEDRIRREVANINKAAPIVRK